jgi:hypothetical protein
MLSRRNLVSRSERMSISRIASRVFLLGSALLVTATITRGAGNEEFTSRLRNAWEKFGDLQELAGSHGARGVIALQQMEMERRQADLRQTIRNVQVEVDSWRYPRHRWTNIQEAYFQELLEYRQQLIETDRTLDELRFQWQQQNELAIRQAEAKGKQVKPLDRARLLQELQRQDRETFDAFRAAKEALVDATKGRPAGRSETLRSAVAEVGRSPTAAARLSAKGDFLKAFGEFCGGKNFFGGKGKKSGSGASGLKSVRKSAR